MDRPDSQWTPAAKPPRKRSRLRTALHVSHVLALIAVAVLLLYVLALPVVVRHVVAQALADLGYPDATFRVRMATLTGVELADIRPAGAQEAVIRSAMVRFSPIRVFGGRLRSVELLGTEIPLEIRNGTVRFTMAPKTGGGASPAAGGSPKPLPFERLDVAASMLRVDWEGRQIRLPLEGSLRPTPTGGRIAMDTFFQGTTIPITGTIDTSGRAVDLSLAATNLSVSGIRSAVPWALMSYPFQTSGRVDLRLAYQLAGGQSVARVHVEPKNLWVAAQPDDHQLAVQHVSGSLDAELLPGMRLGAASGTLRVGKVAWDDLSAREIEVAVRGTGDALQFEGTLASEGWRLTSLKGTAKDLNPGQKPAVVSAEFQARGYPPHQVTDELSRQGIVTADLGKISVGGRTTFTLARVAGAPEPWKLEIPSLEVTLDPGAVGLRRQGVTLAGTSARVLLTGSANAKGGSIEVAKGSRIEIGSVQTAGGYGLKSASAGTPMVAADVVDQPVTVAYQPQDSSGPWRVKVPRLQVNVGKTTVSESAGRTNVAGVEGVLNVGGDVSGRKVSMVTLADSWLGFEGVTAGAADAPVRVAGARFDVVPSAADAPLFGGSPQPRMNVRLRSTTPLDVTASGTTVTAKTVDVTAAADVSAIGGPAIQAEVAVDGAAVKQASWGLTDVAARVPLFWNAPAATRDGSFTVGAVTVGEHKLPAVTGTVRVVDKSVAVTAKSELAKDATVTADANVEWTQAGMVGWAAAKLPSFRLDDEAAFGRVWKPATEIGLTGTFALDGQVVFNGPLVKPHITASVKDGKLTSKAYDLSIEGANGSVTVDSFDPVSGPGRQQLTVDKLHVGKVDFSKGGVEFRVERPDSIHVERTRWGWVGGELYSYDVRINPAKPTTLDAVVYADKLDLSQLLGVIASGEATGKGQLYGRLPVKLNWPDMSFGQGFLYATGSGGINVGKKADTVAGLLDQSDPRFASDPKMKEVKSRILDALRNFNYDTLKVDLIQKDGGLTASVTVNGKGGTGDTAQELDLTVNVNGIDQLLRQALIIKQALGAVGQ